MIQTRFQLLVLRFIALYLRITILGGFERADCEDFLEEVENEIHFFQEDKS